MNVETSFVSRAVAKFVSDGSSTQEFSLFGGLHSNSNIESSGSSSLNAKNKSYLLAEYVRPKLILSVDLDNIKLKDDFKKKVENALDQDEWSSFIELNHLLNEYGYFVPLEFTIGGKICAQTEVNSQISANSQTYASFESAFASKLNLFSSEGSGEGKTSAKSEMKSSQNMFSESDIELEFYGGIGAAAINPLGWIHSLNSYKTWQVIKYGNLVPIICFFDPKLRSKAIRAFVRYSYYPETDKPVLLNGIHYASRALDLINRQKYLPEDSQLRTIEKKMNQYVNLLSF
ncbi:MAC/perforin domain-containing protein [Dapis sp. BLCC M229]|uniref:MAC/perforin domain-containing protein n=1 Tax=Dapis sp. BLCC M229 TaxID=3400188 RepID=UPI003CF874F7